MIKEEHKKKIKKKDTWKCKGNEEAIQFTKHTHLELSFM